MNGQILTATIQNPLERVPRRALVIITEKVEWDVQQVHMNVIGRVSSNFWPYSAS